MVPIQVLVNGIVAAAIFTLVALGFSVMFRVTRVFDMAYAGTLTVSAYLAVGVIGTMALPVMALVIAGAFLGMVIGLLSDVLVFRSLRRRRSPPIVILLASLGLMVVYVNTVSFIFGDSPLRRVGLVAVETWALGPARITPIQVMAVLISLLMTVLCWWLLRYTGWGLSIRAVADDDDLATAVGIRTERAIIYAVLLGSSLGGAGSTLAGLDTGLTPYLGFSMLLFGVVAAVVGGLGSLPGVLVGGTSIALLRQIGAWYLGAVWQDVVLFLVLVMFLLWRPQGLMGGNEFGRNK